MQRLPRFTVWLVAALAAITFVRAHDPFTIVVEGHLGETELGLRVAMDPAVAAYLAGLVPRPYDAFTRPEFAPRQADFDRLAPTLATLFSGNTPLKPTAIRSHFTDDEHVEFLFTYAIPAAGPCRLATAWFQRLPDVGYCALFEFRGKGYAPAARPLLTIDNPAMEFTLTR